MLYINEFSSMEINVSSCVYIFCYYKQLMLVSHTLQHNELLGTVFDFWTCVENTQWTLVI